jgi:hypothetical protein
MVAYGVPPGGGEMLLAPSGYAFAKLILAQEAVELKASATAEDTARKMAKKKSNRSNRLGLPWWIKTAEEHAAADRACGRDWRTKYGCGCSACRAARSHKGYSPAACDH